MCGRAGLKESARLARDSRDMLRRRLPARILDSLQEAGRDFSGKDLPAEFPGGAVPIEEGGVYAALWRLADLAEETTGIRPVGLTVSLDRIPICQETIEVCEILERDPYRIPSGGCLFFVSRDLTADPEEMPGHPQRIGTLNRGRDRVILCREGRRYLERPV